MSLVSTKQRILVCGGGNGAHCLSALAASRDNFEVHVLTLFQDEAERWSNLTNDRKMKLTVTNQDGEQHDIYSKPLLVTKDPEIAISGVNMIFLVVPAFAHAQYLTALLPYLQENTIIVGLPGQAGFEFQCKGILSDVMNTCTIASTETLPFACRIVEFGKHISLLGLKETLGVSFIKGKKCQLQFSVVDKIQEILGEKPKLKLIQHYLAVTLLGAPAIHTGMMYGKWENWDGKPLKTEPLFYQGVDEREADLISKLSDEKVKIARKIGKMRKDIDTSEVIHIFDWLKCSYTDQISDKVSLMTTLQTNKAYEGMVHPMISTEDGYVPNFSHRYLTEDIPYGLVVVKGIAEIIGEDTPTTDYVLEWGQRKIEKEYIIGTKLVGKDVPSARAPQSFGLSTVDDIFTM
jgi:hypothetical protein